MQCQQPCIANAMMLQQMSRVAGVFGRNGIGRAQDPEAA
jgi:hypothetical protein